MDDLITIRPITDVANCEYYQELERRVWGTDETDVVPIHVLITVQKNGGLLLGAYDPDGPAEMGGLVGATFGWLGVGVDPARREEGEILKFCSHMAGVLPAWQGKRVGLRLKLAQREHVLAQGLTDWITWTYDPLYRANAAFNIHRLGATCATYIRDIYGELNDDLNRGVPSDRCQVDWRLRSPHVLHDIEPRRREQAWEAASLVVLPRPEGTRRVGTGDLLAPGDPVVTPDGRPLAVPIPADIALIRRTDRELSMAWRMYVREVLEAAFAEGYTMVDCVHLGDHGWRYILVREYL
jgi:predicted GNAT superfamily acetyltransferase